MKVIFLDSIHKIRPSDLTVLKSVGYEAFDYPFLHFNFLHALEASGSVSKERGWQPHHLVLMEKEKICAFMPNYIKTHSWGEYVFDQDWAHVSQQLGKTYYPKYLTSIPFSPISGPRWLICPHQDTSWAFNQLMNELKKNLLANQISSWHCLFPHNMNQQTLQTLELPIHLLQRSGCQFHWLNKNYSCFDDFLSHLKSKNRKNIRRERKKIQEQKLHINRVLGADISHQDWKLFYQFYANTYLKRNHTPHLNLDFFQRIGETMPNHIHIEWAYFKNQPIGAALFFKDSKKLYGRYWGCSQEFDALHFETCLYRGIEYSIEHQLESFDSGAQGEHKILRGFEPVETKSYHWIKDNQLNSIISPFLDQEAKKIAEYRQQATDLLPYKNQNKLD